MRLIDAYLEDKEIPDELLLNQSALSLSFTQIMHKHTLFPNQHLFIILFFTIK